VLLPWDSEHHDKADTKPAFGRNNPFCLSVKGSIAMWKKLLWASALTGLLAAAAIPLQTTSADACRSGCREAAKAQFPSDSRTRKEYKRYCKSQYKAYKSAGGSGA
jgi:hypothetical protein